MKMTERLRIYLKGRANTEEKKEKYYQLCLKKFICPECGALLRTYTLYLFRNGRVLKCIKCKKEFERKY